MSTKRLEWKQNPDGSLRLDYGHDGIHATVTKEGPIFLGRANFDGNPGQPMTIYAADADAAQLAAEQFVTRRGVVIDWAEGGAAGVLTADGPDGERYRISPKANGYALERAYRSSVREHWGQLAWTDSVDEAKAEAIDIVADAPMREALRRREVTSREETPWGQAQGKRVLAHLGNEISVAFFHTASHGGYFVCPAVNASLPAALRNENHLGEGWYEEDCEWAKVAMALPKLFTPRERRLAEETVRHWMPEAWEAFTGRTLVPGESHRKDEQAWKLANADRLVTTSAVRDPDDQDFVIVTATVGGDRHATAREFRVPAAEYNERGRHGFVIDEDRHEEIVQQAPRP